MSVYFAKGDDSIKIGFSVLVKGRIQSLNTAHAKELEVLAVVDGSMAFERAIHEWLRPYRVRGEWFKDCAPVREVMAAIQERGPVAIGFAEEVPEGKPTRKRMPKEKDELAEVTAAVNKFQTLLNRAQRTRNKELIRKMKPLNQRLLALIDEAIVNGTVYGEDDQTDAKLKAGAQNILHQLRALTRPQPEAQQ